MTAATSIALGWRDFGARLVFSRGLLAFNSDRLIFGVQCVKCDLVAKISVWQVRRDEIFRRPVIDEQRRLISMIQDAGCPHGNAPRNFNDGPD